MPFLDVDHTLSCEFLDLPLPSDEAIQEVMLVYDHPWGYIYNLSAFLP